MGIDYTFLNSSVIFAVIGMGFGASYAAIHVDNILWTYSPWWKKLIRAILGAAISVGIYIAF